MAATIHVLARFVAKAGKEDALKAVLTRLIPPTRRELGCYQYDLLVETADPRQFCFVERWDDAEALDQHLETRHLTSALEQIEDLVESPPDIRRYLLV
jgi:quinol monooxygenase YgiN